MGCCNSRKPPQLTETQDLGLNALNASIDSAANSGTRDGGRHSVRIVLKEIHLTKNTERVTKEACDLSVRIKIADFVCQSRVIEQPSQHTTMREELKSAMNREEDVAEITLLAHHSSDSTELGFATVDLESLLRLKKFGGSVQLYYRCTKSATIVCEFLLAATSNTLDSNYITLGSLQPQSAVMHYFPQKEYPMHANSRLRTPQFTSRTFATSSSADHASASHEHDSRAVILRIKDQKTTIEELLDLVNDERPDIIFYVCQRLQFFASQTNYSRVMIERVWGRLTELTGLMCQDQWVTLQLLWIMFRLLDHMQESKRMEEAGALALAAVVKVWRELLTIEVTSLALEVAVRLVPDGPQKSRLNSLCQNFNLITLLFETLAKFRSSQIVSPTLILICDILDIPNKYEYVRTRQWELLRRGGIIGYLTTFFTEYSLNNEVMITSIKTLQSLSAITYFRVKHRQEEIAAQVKFELLAKVQRRYADDVYKCKFIVAIVRDLAGTQCKLQQPDQLLIAVEILEDIMKRHIDAGSILELALTALKTASGTKDSAVSRKLATHALLELLVEVLDRHATEPKLASQALSLCSALKSHSDSTAVCLLRLSSTPTQSTRPTPVKKILANGFCPDRQAS